MSKLLYSLGRFAYMYRWRVLATWMVLLIAAGTAAFTLMKPTSTNLTIPGLASLEANQRIDQIFGGSGAIDAPTGTVVLRAEDGKTLSDPDVKTTINNFTLPWPP